MTKEVTIANFRHVRALQSAANNFDCDITVTDFNGSIADAKSILGLMSLNYAKPVTIWAEDADVLNLIVRAIKDEQALADTFLRLNPCFESE